jgi:hypothetical protein
MLVQPQISRALVQQPRQRSVRRPFHPSKGQGPYRLPPDVRDRLAAALAPFRNREAAFTLAVFLGRFWSAPGRIAEAFHIDRRELAEHRDLDLSEKQIRSAIRTLEKAGFLDRAVTSGSRYKATEDGLRKKPIRFQFGREYAQLFMAANNRSAAARGGDSRSRRVIAPSQPSRASTALPEARRPASDPRAAAHHPPLEPPLKGPKSKSEAYRSVNLGPLAKGSGIPPEASEPNPKFEAALERFLQIGIRRGRGD